MDSQTEPSMEPSEGEGWRNARVVSAADLKKLDTATRLRLVMASLLPSTANTP